MPLEYYLSKQCDKIRAISYYLAVLKKYAVFSGRAQRAEYWYFLLFNMIIVIVLNLVSSVIGDNIGILGLLFGLALAIPSIAVAVRRLHDTDRSWWWLLIGFVPLVGAIVLIVFMALDSHPGQNRYGLNPKEVAAS